MRVSAAGLVLIAEFEGFSPVLYNDPAGNCTIGYGFLVHLGPCDGRPSEEQWRRAQPLTKAGALETLREKVSVYADAVARRVTVELTQLQFDALTSFCYNVGLGGFERSSVLRAVNARGDVCAELRKYIRGTDGIVYPGLVRRRQRECGMFGTPAPATPGRASEEDEMLRLVWDKDRARVYLLGDFGAAWITDAADRAALEAEFGKARLALSAATIDRIDTVKVETA